MPHIAIEYTANLADEIDVQGLIDSLHDTAQRLNVFPHWGIRTFATVVDHYRVADDVAGGTHGYVHVRLKVAGGRARDTLELIVDECHATLTAALADLTTDRCVGFQLEVFQFDPVTTRSGGSIPGSPTSPDRAGS